MRLGVILLALGALDLIAFVAARRTVAALRAVLALVTLSAFGAPCAAGARGGPGAAGDRGRPFAARDRRLSTAVRRGAASPQLRPAAGVAATASAGLRAARCAAAFCATRRTARTRAAASRAGRPDARLRSWPASAAAAARRQLRRCVCSSVRQKPASRQLDRRQQRVRSFAGSARRGDNGSASRFGGRRRRRIGDLRRLGRAASPAASAGRRSLGLPAHRRRRGFGRLRLRRRGSAGFGLRSMR